MTVYTRNSKKKRIVTISVWVVLIVSICVFVAVPPIVMNDMLNVRIDFRHMYKAEDYGITSYDARLITQDGLEIATYEVRVDDPKAIVMFLSGIHNPSVTAFFGHAKLLQDNGYASLLIEMRARGESEGQVIGAGYLETLEVQAAVDYLKSKPRYEDVPFVVFGLSMGGATAINAIGQIPALDALISLSAFSAWEDVFADNMLDMGAPRFYVWLQKPFVRLYTTFKYGFRSFSLRPKDQIKLLGQRPALIVHSTADHQVPLANFTRLMENAPVHVESWVREGDHHFIINDDFLHPESDPEYVQQVLAFLDQHFGQ